MSNLQNTETIERELSENGFFASNTIGTSMQPLFKTHRDMVMIKRAEGELKKYDVALYKTGVGRYVLHRVVKVKKDSYLIRGDNTYKIETVPKSSVLGVLYAYRNTKKRHTVEDFSYKLYSRIWVFIYPLRLLAYRFRILLSRTYRLFFKK